tara:strand:- start:310 stop:480 length:171 start_codon:yes stop_codon:yes gene_type:complete
MPKDMSDEEALESAVKFSNRYVEKGPYEFFPEKEVVAEVQRGLAENHKNDGYRYCP